MATLSHNPLLSSQHHNMLIEDPMDSSDFDPVAFINQKFPTEASLEDLDTFVVGINSQISALDEEISKAVQEQSISGQLASKDIADAQSSICELFNKINDIRSKASQSERMVQEICSDIKKLDYAKTHLQTSITSLKRLQMLITAVGQLEVVAAEYQYRDAANLLDAVNQLLTHFDKYTSIPLISDISTRVENIQMDLKKHVHYNFREIGQLVDTVADLSMVDLPGNMKSLADACLVVDALGAQARRDLLEEFVQLQLVPYERLFGVDKPHFTLDQVERRWSWFKRLLKTVDTKFANICPPHWRLPLRLCLEFTERTKIHLVLLLTAMESKDQTDVHTLLKALQTALRFEQEMSARFGVTSSSSSSTSASQSSASPLYSEARLDSLKARDQLMYVPTDHNAITKEDEDESGFIGLAHAAISGGISGVFDKFLGSYVLLERQNLEELLQRLSQEEDTAGKDGIEDGSHVSSGGTSGNVYGSAMSMFVFIKNSIKRCTALTTGQTFLSLTKEFKTCMLQYQTMLMQRCPTPIIQMNIPSGGTGGLISGTSFLSTSQPTFKLAPGAEVAICYLINTGEYCSEVVPQLEQMIKQKMSPNFANKVDLNAEVEAFTDLVAHGLKVLVFGILDRLDGAFKTMMNTNWASEVQVTEESAYVHTFTSVLTEAIPKIRDSLTSSYYNNFCTKLATEILNKYLDIINKQKMVSEMGTQQLLLDTYSVKTLLTHLHHLGTTISGGSINSSSAPSGNSERAPIPAMYLKLVATKVSHIEVVLKLLGTPDELLVERFKSMWPDGTSNDLLGLMEKRGMKRPEQQSLLEVLRLTPATSGNIKGGLASVTSSAGVALKGIGESLGSAGQTLGMKWK